MQIENPCVCYEDVRDVFVSRKESVFPMKTHLDMGNNYIYNVRTPVNNDQGADKCYVDQHVAKAGDPTDNADAINKAYADTPYLKLSGGHATDRITKDYHSFTARNALLSFYEMKAWFVQVRNPYVYT